jgi:hypothetical protein
LTDVSADTGVLLVLDRAPYVRGVTADELHRRAAALIHSLLDKGATPILVLTGDLDLSQPLCREYATAFVRLRDDFRCLFVDLRENVQLKRTKL